MPSLTHRAGIIRPHGRSGDSAVLRRCPVLVMDTAEPFAAIAAPTNQWSLAVASPVPNAMTSPRFRPPQQTRSQETLDRILDAAEQVLGEKSFTEATLAEIMDRAGVTVGAFYRRFPDKDALLHLIDQRFFDELYRRADELLDVERWRG